MLIRMAASGNLQTYPKRQGCNNTGYDFELLMSMLVVLRSEMRTESFNFTVHHLNAGDFDDIVFVVKEKEKQDEGYFMQLKYTSSKEEKNEIKTQQMLAESGDYSFIRYYPSYLEIKRNFSNILNRNFVIYTNTSMHRSTCSNNFIVGDRTSDFIDTGGRIFTFTQNSEEYKAFNHVDPYRNKLQELSDRLDKLKELSQKLEILNTLSDILTELKNSSDIKVFLEKLKKLSSELEDISKELELLELFSDKLSKLKVLSDELTELTDKFDDLNNSQEKLEQLEDPSDKLKEVLKEFKKYSEKKSDDKLYEIRQEVYKIGMAHSRQLKNVKNNIFKEKLQKVLSEVLKWDLDTWHEYMENLKVYTDQLSMNELRELVEEEYEKLCGTSETFHEFKNSIAEWRTKNICLTKNLSLFWKEVLPKQRKELMKSIFSKLEPFEKLIFKYTENMKIFENYPQRLIQIVCEGNVEMTCLRIQQSLSNADYLMVDLNVLEESLKQVLFVWKHYQILVIVEDTVDMKIKDDDYEKITKILENILSSDKEKKIVLITNKFNHLKIKCGKSEIISLQEEFKFNQLTSRSQELVLNCHVDFQGYPVKLQSLMSNTEDVTADLIVKLLRREKIVVGGELSKRFSWEPITKNDTFYISRTLLRREIVDENIFKSTKSDCIAFSGVTYHEVTTLLPEETVVQELAEDIEINEECRNFIISETSSFLKLCEKFERVHWIKKIGECFAWMRSKGDIALIKNNLKKNVDPVLYESIHDVLEVPEQVTLIVGEPGMGKSKEVSRLTRVLNEESQTTWVIVVNLNNYKDIITSENATDKNSTVKTSVASSTDTRRSNAIKVNVNRSSVTGTKNSVVRLNVSYNNTRSSMECNMTNSVTCDNSATRNITGRNVINSNIQINSGSQISKQVALSANARMMLCKAGNFKIKFEENLFLHELSHGGNIVPIFSGFDEVSSDCLEKAIGIVKEISSNVKKVFITSTPIMQEKLENEFSCLAFSLKPLSDEDQVEFLQNAWHIPGLSTYYDSARFLSELKILYEKHLGLDLKEFIGIPLHGKILGEVFKSEAKSYAERGFIQSALSIDPLQLYIRFLDEKWKVYCKKCNVDFENSMMMKNAEKWKRDVIPFLKICAVLAFTSEVELKELNNYDKLLREFENGIEEGKENLGMIQNIVDKKPVFVDKNLMKYFFALWLIDNYVSNRQFIMNKLFDIKWKSVRTFVDRVLCTGKDFDLHRAVLNEDLAEVQNLLLIPGKTNVRDNGGRTPLHLAVITQNEDILNMLLKYKANPVIKDRWFGWKPVAFAKKVNWLYPVNILEKKEMEKKTTNSDLNSASA